MLVRPLEKKENKGDRAVLWRLQSCVTNLIQKSKSVNRSHFVNGLCLHFRAKNDPSLQTSDAIIFVTPFCLRYEVTMLQRFMIPKILCYKITEFSNGIISGRRKKKVENDEEYTNKYMFSASKAPFYIYFCYLCCI